MRRCFRWLVALAAPLLLWSAAAGQDSRTATVVVQVPPDARLYFDGQEMKKTGELRTFPTPPLDPGVNYSYDVKAEVDRDGRTLSATQHVTVQAGKTVSVDFRSLGGGFLAAPDSDPWPRKVAAGDATITVYQPQVAKWEKNRLEGRAAVAVEKKAAPQPAFGVVTLAARTDVDKEHRSVTLEDFEVVDATFPSAPEKAKGYLEVLRKVVPGASRTISLDRLEASLAVSRAEARGKDQPLKNEPPRILVSKKPAVLILIDGPPALRQMDGSKLLRVINTRALILIDQATGKHYLHLLDRWMEAGDVAGPWAAAKDPPAELRTLRDNFAADPQVDLLDNPAQDIKEAFENGVVPAVYVSTTPAELIELQGEPDFAPIDGTKLLWVKNTTSQILMDTADSRYYVLLSGRWFRAKSLEGPWEFVAADKLPADFAKVPETHPRGDILSSVAGTPQAREALIANRVPQTAAIKRSEAKIAPVFDGKPQLQPIEGTALQYVVNTPTPIVQVAPDSYYALENGVWFAAPSVEGPWAAAPGVPDAIYTIPTSSPIWYATNAYVYGFTPDYVYVGYTPGYFGTCVAPSGVVVYGTGWNFAPWLGRAWYGRPWTYGWGARFGWTAGGFGFGFAAGVGRPWWGPVGWNARWGGTAWRAGWERGWGGAYAGAHVSHVNFNNVNVYNRWGASVHSGRTTVVSHQAAVAGYQRGLNNVVAGADGAAYRRTATGWETHTAEGWRGVDARTAAGATARQVNADWGARRVGEAGYGAYHSSAGAYAGYHNGYSGFRSYGGYRGGYRAGGFHGGRR
jgi:uncharacterized protein (TIGR03000 family)